MSGAAEEGTGGVPELEETENREHLAASEDLDVENIELTYQDQQNEKGAQEISSRAEGGYTLGDVNPGVVGAEENKAEQPRAAENQGVAENRAVDASQQLMPRVEAISTLEDGANRPGSSTPELFD